LNQSILPREDPRKPILLQALSLYLLLLAFFVVLNSISSVEEARSRGVVGSLNETFSSTGSPSETSRHLVSSLGDTLGRGRMLSQLGKLVKTEISLARVDQVRHGRMLEITMPVNAMFASAKAAIDPSRRRLIERIVEILQNTSRGVRYDVDILVSSGTEKVLSRKRAAFLGTVFVGVGAPILAVISGTEQGTDGKLRLRFHIRPEKITKLSFGEVGQE
jgi:hypothetical protein